MKKQPIHLQPFSLHLNLDSFNPASAEDKEYMVKMRPSSTFFKDGVKRLLKNPVATVAFFIVLIITISCIVIPFFWPYSYEQFLGNTPGQPMDASFKNLKPGFSSYSTTELERIAQGEKIMPHIFGTDPCCLRHKNFSCRWFLCKYYCAYHWYDGWLHRRLSWR